MSHSPTAMETSKMQAITQFQNWPASVYILLVTGLVTLLASLARRPSLDKRAPKLIREGYPILGMLRFFSDRVNFVQHGTATSKSGNFSFYYGKHSIVSLSGLDGRKTFFDSRDLNMNEGYAVLFGQAPSSSSTGETLEHDKWFSKTITNMMKKENFVRNLPILVNDARKRLDAIIVREGQAGLFDPYDDLYRLVYQLTMRTVGTNDVAESPELLAKTLNLFEQIEKSASPARIIFPWLPTLSFVRRMIAGTQLYMIFNKIVKQRKETGTRGDDPLQFLIDSGDSMERILAFVLGALFAGQLNSGINAAAMFVELAAHPEWYRRVQDEVDGTLARHRSSPDQTPADILATLTIEEWESEFPMIDLCLRECIRHTLVGTAFRKNISGKDVPIGKTGEVIPRDGFVLYLLDDIHFDPEVYSDPYGWDPGRYLPDRAEDKKRPLGYLGWGLGRHPCLGMRFAKLEMGMIGALFVAMFDYELCDAKGNKMTQAPKVNRATFSASKPEPGVRLKYTVRQH